MAFIRSFGSYFPSRVVSNAEIGAMVGCDSEWIQSVSGIEERRFAGDGESVADLAVSAGLDCLTRAGLAPSEVGFVVLNTSTGRRQFPGPAAEVARRLGCACPAIDLSHASTGSLIGLELARHLAVSYGTVLVVAAEKMSEVILRQPMDRSVAVLFGDAAGACLVSASAGELRLVDAHLESAGEFTGDLKLEWNQPLEMNGRSVIMQASRKLPRAIRDLLAKNGRTPDEVDQFLVHQANQNLIVRVAASLGVNESKFYSHIRHFGNTSSASMLAAAAEWSAKTSPHGRVVVCLAAFGSGFQWGAVLAEGST